jgi:hypothetical protein
MSNMTEQEIMNSTMEHMVKWFHEESGILEILYAKENEMNEMYGEGMYMCPYYETFIQLAIGNMYKGWSKEELIRDLTDILPEEIDE